MVAPTKPVVFIVGPTASGKSELAMRIAKEFEGELVCADSQTIRRDLNIGTAKPSAEDRKEVPHHLLDLINPYVDFSVAEFKDLATQAIKDIKRRQKLPIIVGGTGLYVDSVFYNYDLQSQVTADRDVLESMSVVQLQTMITKKGYDMPKNNHNPRHLIGAILRSGKNPSNISPISNSLIYGLSPTDKVLKTRISNRVEHMFEAGFVDEVIKIVRHYGKPVKRIDAIGYPIVIRLIDGDITESDAKDLLKKGDWQYARRQKSWFKRNKSIRWFEDSEQAFNQALKDLSAN